MLLSFFSGVVLLLLFAGVVSVLLFVLELCLCYFLLELCLCYFCIGVVFLLLHDWHFCCFCRVMPCLFVVGKLVLCPSS